VTIIYEQTFVHLAIVSRITLKSIAEEADISYSVVSRVLSGNMGNTRVSKNKIDKIKTVATKLGYTPNPVASSLRSGKTNNIGLILTSTANPFFTDMLNTFEEVATGHNHSIIFNTSRNSIEDQISAVRKMLNSYASGVILNTWGDSSQDVIQTMIEKEGIKTPIIFISQTTETGNYVRCDLNESYANATLKLINKGYYKIGYLGVIHNEDRHEGLFNTLAQNDLSCNYQIPCEFTDGEFMSAYKETLTYLESGKPLAQVYFCYSDLVALGMYRAFTEKGLRVPDDVAIITTDNSVLAKTNCTPLTSLAYPSEEIARLAIDTILNGTDIQKTLIAPVVWRESTK
jgi:LacI family transcriptional regulator